MAAVVLATVLVLTRDETPPGRGDLIAYSCTERANDWFAVCVVRMDGTGTHRVTEKLPTSDPVWSPDGRKIAFTRHHEAGEYSVFQDDDIFVMEADGDDPRQLTENEEGRSSGVPAWSPDGRRIAFVRGSGVPTGGVQQGSIYVMNADGGNLRRLTRGHLDTDPAWSPDGREIAFSRASNFPQSNADIYVVSADGAQARRVTRTAADFESEPTWSKNGKRIAFTRSTRTSSVDGTAAIYVMNRDGGGLKRIVAHRHFTRNPGNLAWAPDARTIAFETSLDYDCTAIYLVDVGGGKPRPLTSCAGGAGSALSPSWQPAGD